MLISVRVSLFFNLLLIYKKKILKRVAGKSKPFVKTNIVKNNLFISFKLFFTNQKKLTNLFTH